MFRSCSSRTVVAAMTPGSRVHHCLRHSVSAGALLLLLLLALLDSATPQFLEEDDLNDITFMAPDKRPARLSYFRAPHGGGYVRGRYNPYASNGYDSHSYGGGYGMNNWWRKKAVNRHSMPWENLPNTNCLRQFCRSDNDCCRRYSKCNEEARVCYDCWYGHPCNTNTDCCERYPVCNSVLRTCGK